MVKLKPCPFCGGKAKTKAVGSLYTRFNPSVVCEQCGVKMPGERDHIWITEKDGKVEIKQMSAMEMWNQRTFEPFVVLGNETDKQK